MNGLRFGMFRSELYTLPSVRYLLYNNEWFVRGQVHFNQLMVKNSVRLQSTPKRKICKHFLRLK